jgi:hypothetical protein
MNETTVSPLEVFLRDYLETAGGVWDEVEPQVYDVLLPDGAQVPAGRGNADGVVRLAFDPEALPEHPSAQLASFGTPLVDQLLGDALQRGRAGHFYLVGLNLQPHDLSQRVRRAVTVAAPAELSLERVRALHFPQALFWFQAGFVSDQKEQVILPVAVDLHHGREVRHMDEVLDESRLLEKPTQPLPPARSISLAEGYRRGRTQILRTVAALANQRGRELLERRDQQIARLNRYYADLRTELDEQLQRARNVEEARARHAERLATLEREEKLRTAELRQKSQLHADLRLLQLLRIEQPKLLITAVLSAKDHASGRLEVVWDPLTEMVEAAKCPNCGRPSYSFVLNRAGQVGCENCGPALLAPPSRRR